MAPSRTYQLASAMLLVGSLASFEEDSCSAGSCNQQSGRALLQTASQLKSPAPVCSSWKLEIAAENKDWEAHIFEIELYSGDDLISPPGLGTATSDCERSSAEGAFDGDTSTKWVTCSGAKVGKSVTYHLNQPNGVTKIKTIQWSSANNAIPKFDLYCSRDDATFSYVWTADLGSGAGTNEAVSGLSAPTEEMIAAFAPPTSPTTTTTTVDPALLAKPRIFLTSEKHSMNLGGIGGADAICTNEAGQAAKALLADESGCDGFPCRRASMGTWPPTEGRVDWPLVSKTTYFNKDWSQEVVTTDCHGLMAGKLMNPVTTTECYNQVTGLMPDFSTASSTCESYSSAESADQVVVGWSCSDTAKGLVYSWGGGDHGTMSCNSEKHFLCVTTPGSPDLPVDEKCADFDVYELEDYQQYISGSGKVVVYQGPRLALVIADSARRGFDPDMHDSKTTEAMKGIVSNLEKMLYIYDDVVGMVPQYYSSPDSRLEGRIPNEVNYLQTAAGLAGAAVAGVAVGPDFVNGMLTSALEGRQVIDHIFFYENFRNYMFPEVFTKVLDYHTSESYWSSGWVNQGFVNIFGCLVSVAITPPVEFTYFGTDRDGFMEGMENHLMTYVENPEYNVNNTFMKGFLPWRSQSSLDNLYSGLNSFLFRKCGGVTFLKGFFGALKSLLVRAPSSKADYETAMENYYIAASIGANADLKDFFIGEMRWKLRAEALDFVSARGLTDHQSLSATTTTTTVIGPLCSSWKLEIAAENKDWEAHIFEIELYSGDDLISGPGMGTATSDCERSSAEGAFDGDTSTTWVTCSGAKVGKSVTYKLRSPNCVTKIKAIQFNGKNNAIPKFDLYCSTDAATFSYVWTADLGTGKGTNEAVSGLVAPPLPPPPAPVCSSWKLEIAAENKDWEAHIFEIELYSGDVIISGSGMGTATSDCERSSAEGAFDGDTSTKWVTCSGAKVGKSVTYQLHQPNGVTKIKTKQWSSANNAIPKFDLYCSTDDATFSYVWTADLGSGAGTEEAVSGLVAPEVPSPPPPTVAPVCSSWKLEIAAENKDWEAHIFEIELYSGDEIISGSGLGTATSDCERSSAEGAFDGDTSTKWVTCSGAKVGKSVTYQLHQPNGVTKIKTKQWSSANNAIPKFDLYCSTDDVTFSYVWTADLGSGAGTEEAVSGLAAPS